jgi:hypothetical protein
MVIQEAKKAVDEFIKDLDTIAKEMFMQYGQLPIMFSFLTQENGEFTPNIADLSDIHRISKDMYLETVARLIRDKKPIAIGTITEAWMLKRGIEDVKLTKRVSEHEDKIEAIIISVETYDEAFLKIYEINRENPEVKIELAEDRRGLDKSNVQGTFTNLLKENYEEFYNELKIKLNNNLN